MTDRLERIVSKVRNDDLLRKAREDHDAGLISDYGYSEVVVRILFPKKRYNRLQRG